MAKSDHSDTHTKAERIARLRQRLDQALDISALPSSKRLAGVLKGILDLLADEL